MFEDTGGHEVSGPTLGAAVLAHGTVIGQPGVNR